MLVRTFSRLGEGDTDSIPTVATATKFRGPLEFTIERLLMGPLLQGKRIS